MRCHKRTGLIQPRFLDTERFHSVFRVGIWGEEEREAKKGTDAVRREGTQGETRFKSWKIPAWTEFDFQS